MIIPINVIIRLILSAYSMLNIPFDSHKDKNMTSTIRCLLQQILCRSFLSQGFPYFLVQLYFFSYYHPHSLHLTQLNHLAYCIEIML